MNKCIDCGKELNSGAKYHKTKRCNFCANKITIKNRPSCAGLHNPNYRCYKYTISKDFLIREYIKNEKFTTEIASMIGCSRWVITHRLNKYGIKIKPSGGFFRKGKPYPEQSIRLKGKKRPPYISKNMRLLWQDKKYIIRVMKARLKAISIKPNKPERRLNNLLQEMLPKEYKYVGNWKFVIGRYNPDFVNVNGQKKIIELFGDYWHNLPNYKKRDKKRIPLYKKFGYQTLVVWQHELKDLDRLKFKILKFNKKDLK